MGCPTQRITRCQGDWLNLTLYETCIRYNPPAYAGAPCPRGSGWRVVDARDSAKVVDQVRRLYGSPQNRLRHITTPGRANRMFDADETQCCESLPAQSLPLRRMFVMQQVRRVPLNQIYR